MKMILALFKSPAPTFITDDPIFYNPKWRKDGAVRVEVVVWNPLRMILMIIQNIRAHRRWNAFIGGFVVCYSYYAPNITTGVET